MPTAADPFHLPLVSKDGSGTAAGLRRLPGDVVQAAPQVGVAPETKPLNAFGAAPPVRMFVFAHWALQNVTWPEVLWSPITKVPSALKANGTVTVKVDETELGVSSALVAVHVTVVVPSANVEPDGWSHVTAGSPSSSEAVGGA